ncbi:hypothetical protein CC86DRAFT_417742 [Ophiobolus disseminans]|uniref:Uncharacterized protein n=1 Tax=Ophiobolus disseminans TaxID=1469910 RepID=A0A6A7A0A5_9PLEO|nr:hypothetical protein CC86DRAFT_417742 [Ophiobolus disseminans]
MNRANVVLMRRGWSIADAGLLDGDVGEDVCLPPLGEHGAPPPDTRRVSHGEHALRRHARGEVRQDSSSDKRLPSADWVRQKSMRHSHTAASICNPRIADLRNAPRMATSSLAFGKQLAFCCRLRAWTRRLQRQLSRSHPQRDRRQSVYQSPNGGQSVEGNAVPVPCLRPCANCARTTLQHSVPHRLKP